MQFESAPSPAHPPRYVGFQTRKEANIVTLIRSLMGVDASCTAKRPLHHGPSCPPPLRFLLLAPIQVFDPGRLQKDGWALGSSPPGSSDLLSCVRATVHDCLPTLTCPLIPQHRRFSFNTLVFPHTQRQVLSRLLCFSLPQEVQITSLLPVFLSSLSLSLSLLISGHLPPESQGRTSHLRVHACVPARELQRSPQLPRPS